MYETGNLGMLMSSLDEPCVSRCFVFLGQVLSCIDVSLLCMFDNSFCLWFLSVQQNGDNIDVEFRCRRDFAYSAS